MRYFKIMMGSSAGDIVESVWAKNGILEKVLWYYSLTDDLSPHNFRDWADPVENGFTPLEEALHEHPLISEITEDEALELVFLNGI